MKRYMSQPANDEYSYCTLIRMLPSLCGNTSRLQSPVFICPGSVEMFIKHFFSLTCLGYNIHTACSLDRTLLPIIIIISLAKNSTNLEEQIPCYCVCQILLAKRPKNSKDI